MVKQSMPGFSRMFFRLLMIFTVCTFGSILFASPVSAVDSESSDPTAIVLFAVGDVAQCDGVSPVDAPTAKVARLLANSSAPILMVGDIAYPKGSATDFSECFAPVWGNMKTRMLPVPGNHEYETLDAEPYYKYFGAAAGEAGRGYYAVQIGAWRVIGLNSNIDSTQGSTQERWLKQELANHPSHCTLAIWHHPRFSSGRHGNTLSMQAIWKDLFDAGVEIAITGHDHDYERFAPQGDAGTADATRGIREFVVGTGGAVLRPFGQVEPNSEVRIADNFGALKLTLGKSGYEWQFLPADGGKVNDQGAATCHE